MTPDEILGCPMDEVTRVFPHWHCGSDLTGNAEEISSPTLFPATSSLIKQLASYK